MKSARVGKSVEQLEFPDTTGVIANYDTDFGKLYNVTN